MATAVGLATVDPVHVQQTATYWTSHGQDRTTFGDRTFTVAGPPVLNSLPQSSGAVTGRCHSKRLKTYLMGLGACDVEQAAIK